MAEVIKEQTKVLKRKLNFNPLSANPTKWSNTLKQNVGNFPTNCLRVFDHFVKLAFKELIRMYLRGGIVGKYRLIVIVIYFKLNSLSLRCVIYLVLRFACIC